ncbi:hypothetical protein [Nonomuraea sp. NPDC050643]|uniref:hypothetical protein n=1 Tax=Nonomuraea sp. NPDC050643 TaxID=3155660 RepID=UPI0033EA3E0B
MAAQGVRHRSVRLLQNEVVVEIRLESPGSAIDESGRHEDEKEDYFDFRWWPVTDVVSSEEQFYPRRLPGLLMPFLAGQDIDEDFEFWS